MAVSPILILHVSAGTVGLLSGTVALTFRKGSEGHRKAGNVFFVAMLCMAGAAFYLAIVKSLPHNIFGAVFTFYLLTTAWLTGRHSDGKPGVFDWLAMLFAVAVGAGILLDGIEQVTGQKAPHPGIPVGMNFFMGSVVLLAAAGDLRMLVRGGISGAKRIARHLWRMCFGLFIATASLFLGQQQVFPMWLRKSNLLFIPALLPLVVLIFWILRVRFSDMFKGNAAPRSSA